jgi:hypothetical protein
MPYEVRPQDMGARQRPMPEHMGLLASSALSTHMEVQVLMLTTMVPNGMIWMTMLHLHP